MGSQRVGYDWATFTFKPKLWTGPCGPGQYGGKKGMGKGLYQARGEWGKETVRPQCGASSPRTCKDAAGETVIRPEGALDDSEGSRTHCPQDMQEEESVRRELTVALEARHLPSPSTPSNESGIPQKFEFLSSFGQRILDTLLGFLSCHCSSEISNPSLYLFLHSSGAGPASSLPTPTLALHVLGTRFPEAASSHPLETGLDSMGMTGPLTRAQHLAGPPPPEGLTD